MARYDKYEPMTGGHRAPLAADWLLADVEKVVAVSLNASGQVVKGTAGQSGYIGVLCLTQIRRAGEIVDVMQDGEITELTSLVAGQKYYWDNTAGALSTSAAAGANPKVGWTVEATRLVVRCNVSA